jgi:hypothetical protein
MKSTDKNVEVNYVLVSHNNDIVTHQESDYDGDTETHHMPRKRIVTKRKTKTQHWVDILTRNQVLSFVQQVYTESQN